MVSRKQNNFYHWYKENIVGNYKNNSQKLEIVKISNLLVSAAYSKIYLFDFYGW